MLDRMDRKILDILQQDCTLPVAEIGKQIGLSTTPCWRRIQKLEESGVIQRRVAMLDAKKVNVGVTVFVSITTASTPRNGSTASTRRSRTFPRWSSSTA